MDEINEIMDAQLAKMREHSPVTFSPFGSIIATLVLTYSAKFISAFLCILTGNGYSNAHPREVGPPKCSMASRAQAAHNNGFEALIMLTAAVFMGTVAGMNGENFEDLCTLFVFGRLGHLVSYILGFNEVLSFVRSGFFAVTVLVVARIMLTACDAKYGYIFKVKNM